MATCQRAKLLPPYIEKDTEPLNGTIPSETTNEPHRSSDCHLVANSASHASCAKPESHKAISIRQNASIYSLVNLPRPDKSHDLELLLAQNGMTTQPGRKFESKEWCQREDARRAAALKQAMVRDDWPDTSDPEDRLDRLLEDYAKDDNPYDYSPASATFMREIRLNFFGAVLELVESVPSYDFAWVTASRESWQVSIHERYLDERFFDIPRIFRSLLRIGGVITAPGFLIMCLHAQYDVRGHFQLQFRGVCTGEKLKRFRSLPETIADPENAPLIRDYIGPFPLADLYIGAQVPSDFAEEIINIMPNGVTPRVRTRGGPHCGAPEPHHSVYLLWAHLYRSQPIIIMSGAGITDDGRLVLTQEP